jgi:hypothetical protein
MGTGDCRVIRYRQTHSSAATEAGRAVGNCHETVTNPGDRVATWRGFTYENETPESTGLEPATSAVTGRRSNQLS